MRSLALIFAATLLSGCAHQYAERLDAALGGWVGQHPDRLVEAWGAPHSSYVFENGSKALTYEDSETYTRSFGRSVWWRTDTISSSETCRISFFTDATQKKIERYTYKGYPSTCLDIMDSVYTPKQQPKPK